MQPNERYLSLSLFCFLVLNFVSLQKLFTQEVPSSETEFKSQIQEYQDYKFNNEDDFLNLYKNQTSFSNHKQENLTFKNQTLLLPEYLSEDKRNEIQQLFLKLQQLCPECSNGNTIGGPVIVGPNTYNSSKPSLFGSYSSYSFNRETDTIVKIQDYKNLEKKAMKYEQSNYR